VIRGAGSGDWEPEPGAGAGRDATFSVSAGGARARVRGDGEPLLRVQDLRVGFSGEEGTVRAVDGISFGLARGGALGIVGESGSGKSLTALSILGLTRTAPGAHVSGCIEFEGRDLLALPEDELRTIRGNEIAMVFQDPLSSLHPLYRVGAQIVEAIRAHRPLPKAKARAHAIELLDLVGIPDPARRVAAYPHELSGGQRQRAMIAMALANEPKLLLADEPTTALDVTVQAQILALLGRLRRELSMALVFVTHDLGVVAEVADEVLVMQKGRIVERASAAKLFASPKHVYTKRLLRAMPTIDGPPPAPLPATDAEPLLRVRGLAKRFPLSHGVIVRRRVGAVDAVDGIDFEVMPGETFGIVGESGSGKTTTARLIARLLAPSAGEVSFQGRDVAALRGRELKALRRDLQMIFQDPYSSLNPRKTAGAIVAEPLAVHRVEPDRARRRRAAQGLLETVGLNAGDCDRYPHEFSGGQRQRIGIARALALEPKLIVADEPVSALDVSIQAQVLELLRSLRERLGLTLVFISHDLAVVRHMCDRIAVMQQGRIVELATNEDLYRAPRDPYTRELLAAVPGAHGLDRRTIHA
jgi:ABC-type microcin C transport system duplicated ATPase subunit YejF